MTDPQTQWQQQSGQQWYTDDILNWDDIFAPDAIDQAESEDDLPYGDILEKKYQYEAIPESKEFPVEKESEEVIFPVEEKNDEEFWPVEEVPEVEKISPIEEIPEVEQTVEFTDTIDKVAEREIQNIDQQAAIEQEKVWTLLDTQLQTDVQKKFGELFFTIKRIHAIKNKLWNDEESFDILWADNDKIFISYRFVWDEANDPTLIITKVEQDKSTEEETINELRFMFNEELSSLEVMVNDIMLFDEIKDFTEDQRKKMQVSEKLNKFIFLTSEEQKKLEKEIQMKEDEEKEKRKLQDVFRNF